ncbi:MAG: glucokinase [SAR324 cluster bacterium]|nr:glucokinase [SAR324 cluster bacterium]
MKILAADIGGTNSRFAVFEKKGTSELEMLASEKFLTGSFSSFEQMLQTLGEDSELPIRECNAAVFAVPGAVRQKKICQPANISWLIDVSKLSASGFPPSILINDFVAQAFACRSPAVKNPVLIRHAIADAEGVVGVIGAGTGLGHCALVPLDSGNYVAVPSESGHVGFMFTGAEEKEYERFLARETGKSYGYGDIVVSGMGLSLVHHFLYGHKLSPAEVSNQLDNFPKTVEWFARFYARACRHYALSVLATGGLFIAGGVAAKNPGLVNNLSFLNEFLNSPTQEALLRTIPVFLNLNEDSGLFGAALYGIQFF